MLWRKKRKENCLSGCDVMEKKSVKKTVLVVVMLWRKKRKENCLSGEGRKKCKQNCFRVLTFLAFLDLTSILVFIQVSV